MKMLVAIMSCHKDRLNQQAQRDTWLRDVGGFVDYKFFLGLPTPTFQDTDEVFLDVDDSYQCLAEKTRAMCQWAEEHDYDFMFKCDVDTLVNTKRASYEGEDYKGGENADVLVPGFPSERIEFCSGGAGYWLSRKALTLVANADSIKTSAEDVFVAHVLKEAGIRPVFHQGYRWRSGADVDKDVVTLHLSSALQKKYEPSQMYEYYKKIKETL